MTTELYFLDLIGTLAFAMYGSYFALKKGFDLFGIFLSAFLTAVGGGTLRDLFLNINPAYFFDPSYLVVIFLGMGITIYLYNHFHRIKKFVRILDSLGLVTFAFIGASKAFELHYEMGAIIFFAVLTAVGGGVLRDVLLNKTPEIMYRDLYATIALLLGVVFAFFPNEFSGNFFWANALLVTFFLARMMIMYFDIHLWTPQKTSQKTS